ncbi:hypothetical protein ACFX1S_026936 [Malus domestica]
MNSVIELYFQVEQEAGIESIRLKALIDLFDEIVEPLFNQLRMKEQLGYVVECGPQVTYRVYGSDNVALKQHFGKKILELEDEKRTV